MLRLIDTLAAMWLDWRWAIDSAPPRDECLTVYGDGAPDVLIAPGVIYPPGLRVVFEPEPKSEPSGSTVFTFD